MTHPIARYSYALLWSALITLLLVQSSQQPVVGAAAPPGSPPPEREIMLFLGHVVGFSVLMLLWWWAFVARLQVVRALILAVVVALCLGIITELAQTLVPDREASWFDIITNTVTIVVTAGSIWQFNRTFNIEKHNVMLK